MPSFLQRSQKPAPPSSAPNKVRAIRAGHRQRKVVIKHRREACSASKSLRGISVGINIRSAAENRLPGSLHNSGNLPKLGEPSSPPKHHWIAFDDAMTPRRSIQDRQSAVSTAKADLQHIVSRGEPQRFHQCFHVRLFPFHHDHPVLSFVRFCGALVVTIRTMHQEDLLSACIPAKGQSALPDILVGAPRISFIGTEHRRSGAELC
mmetsp:Transcript_11794/g.43927  ORF Transcript_11794/g.43927 Transcript_11794/m.43927 type:complete len:206 (-) Transcript_11794:118-735(-)